MYYKGKRQEVSSVKQSEDRGTRFDYGKVKFDVQSGIVGENEKIRDCR